VAAVRVTVEGLLRTGLRVGEYTSLPADAMVQIGAAPWLQVPVGKLPNDRYLPLHPNLVGLIDDYRARHVPPDHPLLLPRENGRPVDRHTVTRFINKAGAAAGLPHIHPHQLRHTLATQAINHGMSLEAIAAMLGHRSMDMTLRYAKIANRTVADEYFAVTDKVEALYGKPHNCPPTRSARRWPGSAANTTACSATATAPDRPSWIAPSSPSARPARSSRPASRSGPPCKPNTTMPPATINSSGPTCSNDYSTTSTTTKHHDPLDTDHPHSADLRASYLSGRRNG
jgi:Phage integrase family